MTDRRQEEDSRFLTLFAGPKRLSFPSRDCCSLCPIAPKGSSISGNRHTPLIHGFGDEARGLAEAVMKLHGAPGGQVVDARDLANAREVAIVGQQDVLAVGCDGGEEKRPVTRFGWGR